MCIYRSEISIANHVLIKRVRPLIQRQTTHSNLRSFKERAFGKASFKRTKESRKVLKGATRQFRASRSPFFSSHFFSSRIRQLLYTPLRIIDQLPLNPRIYVQFPLSRVAQSELRDFGRFVMLMRRGEISSRTKCNCIVIHSRSFVLQSEMSTDNKAFKSDVLLFILT